jgi:tRNA(fMet)-specific endonuclease VapC
MADPTLEERVTTLEQLVAKLMRTIETSGRTKDWRRTVGMFDGDPIMQEIIACHCRRTAHPGSGSPAHSHMIILDTDHISLLQAREAPHAFVLQARLEAFPPDEVATTVVTLEEQMRGWLGLIHGITDVQRQVAYYEWLLGLVAFFAAWEVLPFDHWAATMFAQRRQQRVRIGTMDLKIAASVLAHNALLWSGNLREFQQVPGLRVEDWRQLDFPPSSHPPTSPQ